MLSILITKELISMLASMPDLIDREPDHVRIETDLAYSSSNPYPGLMTVQEQLGKDSVGYRHSRNWKLDILHQFDDGSELWINGISLVQNYGMHGMREFSGFVNLTAGHHDFRIEFFQGGGPHGLNSLGRGPMSASYNSCICFLRRWRLHPSE